MVRAKWFVIYVTKTIVLAENAFVVYYEKWVWWRRSLTRVGVIGLTMLVKGASLSLRTRSIR